MIGAETLYFFLLIAFLGLCILFLAGYLRYRGRHEMILYFLGTTLIGIGFINVSAVRPAAINVFVIFIWLIIHLFVSWLIVEGSTRFFILRSEKKIKSDDEVIKKDPDKWYPEL